MPRLDAIGIVCSDLSASLRFYRLLGLDLPEEPGSEDHIEAKTASGLRVMLDSLELIKSISPDWEPPIGHRMGLAFLCDSPADVDAVHTRVIAQGHKSKTDPWDAFWGQRYAQVIDPDGNVVDLFAPL